MEKKLKDFIEKNYKKIKGQKKSPKNFQIFKENGFFGISKSELSNITKDSLVGNLYDLYQENFIPQRGITIATKDPKVKKEKVLTTEEFNALPLSEQRIMIAKDVIANLKARIYQAKSGVYTGDVNYFRGDIKKNFKKIKNCNVCALGSCLLSTVKFKNTLKFEDLDNYRSDSKQTQLITSIFEPNQLALIEKAFEGSRYISMWSNERGQIGGKLTETEKDKAIAFYNRFDTATDRLIAIMRNIIKNNGTFVL